MARYKSTINRKTHMDYIDPNATEKRLKPSSNPSVVLKQHAQELWAMRDAEELKSRALELVGECLGHGLSQENWMKFKNMLAGADERGGWQGVRSFLTNYSMSGHDHGVVKLTRESQKALANVIYENANVLFKSNPRVAELRLFKAVEHSIGVSIDESTFEAFVAKMPKDPKNYHSYLAETVAKAFGMRLVESEEASLAGMLTESAGTVKDIIAKEMRKYNFFIG